MENQERTEPVFADGLMWKDKHPNAPEFVKGSLSINVESFYQWAKQHVNEKGWVSLDMKESKKGGIYYQLNTFVPKKPEGIEQPKEDSADSSIPF